MGDHAQTEPMYREALAITKKTVGVDHPLYAAGLNNLAGLYQAMGDYARAEPMLRQVLAITKKAVGIDHPDYAQSLNNLATLYKDIGDYARAEPMLREALTIMKKAVGVDHPHYALLLNNLAALYQATGDYARAEPLYGEALAIMKRAALVNHTDDARWLTNLAALYSTTGDYARAEPMYREALANMKDALGGDHPDYATGLNDLALMYWVMGDHARAEPMFREALAIREKALGIDHPDYAQSLNNLAGLYQTMGDDARAEPVIIEALKIISRFTRGTSAVLGERQRLRIYRSQRVALDAYLSMSRSTGAKPADLYRHVLDWKGAAEARRSEDRLARDQPELRLSLAELSRVRSQLANLAFRVPPAGEGQAWRQQLDKLRSQRGSRGGSGPSECRLPRTEASGTVGARRGGRGPACRGGPGPLPRIYPLQPTPGWQGATSERAAPASVRRAPRPARGRRPPGGGSGHRRVGPVLAACHRFTPGRRLANGGRRAGPAGLGAATAPSGRRPDRPDRPRRQPLVLPIRGLAREAAQLVPDRGRGDGVRRLGSLGHRGSGRPTRPGRARTPGGRRR